MRFVSTISYSYQASYQQSSQTAGERRRHLNNTALYCLCNGMVHDVCISISKDTVPYQSMHVRSVCDAPPQKQSLLAASIVILIVAKICATYV